MGIEAKQEKGEKKPGFIRRRVQGMRQRFEDIEPRLAATLIWGAGQNDGD